MNTLKNIVLVDNIKYYLRHYLKTSGITVLNPVEIKDEFITYKFDPINVNYDTLAYLLDPTEDEASDRLMVGGTWYRVELGEENTLKVTKA